MTKRWSCSKRRASWLGEFKEDKTDPMPEVNISAVFLWVTARFQEYGQTCMPQHTAEIRRGRQATREFEASTTARVDRRWPRGTSHHFESVGASGNRAVERKTSIHSQKS